MIEGLMYDRVGNITRKTEIYTNLREDTDQVVTTYHKNGNPSEGVNSIKNITEEYYQNGRLKIEIIDSKATAKYNLEGKLAEEWYITEKSNCRELYDRGITVQKTCEDRSIKETAVSYCKSGKLAETKKL